MVDVYKVFTAQRLDIGQGRCTLSAERVSGAWLLPAPQSGSPALAVSNRDGLATELAE